MPWIQSERILRLWHFTVHLDANFSIASTTIYMARLSYKLHTKII